MNIIYSIIKNLISQCKTRHDQRKQQLADAKHKKKLTRTEQEEEEKEFRI